METSSNLNFVYKGDKGGNIEKVDIVEDKESEVYRNPDQNPVIALKLDEKNNKLWVGTTASSIKCIDLFKSSISYKSASGPKDNVN